MLTTGSHVLRLIVLTCLLRGGGGSGTVKSGKVEYVRLPLLVLESRHEESPVSLSSSTTTAVLSATSTATPSTVLTSTLPPVQFVNGNGSRRIVLHSGRDRDYERDRGKLGPESRSALGPVPTPKTVEATTLFSNLTRPFNVNELVNNISSIFDGDDDDGNEGDGIDDLSDFDDMEEGGGGGSEGDENAEDVGEDDEEIFNELDLVEFVQTLERQADAEERTGLFPEILDILHGPGSGRRSTTTTPPSAVTARGDFADKQKPETVKSNRNQSDTSRLSVNVNGDLELGSEDLSNFSGEIVDGISAGVEESLRMLDDLEPEYYNSTYGKYNSSAETRQFAVYLFQGQYYAEPRLNRFIDGALRNMGTELRVAQMDPLYFRVLPRGQVAEREQPLMMTVAAPGGGVRRRRPGKVQVGVGGIGGGGGVAIGRHSIAKRQVKMPAFFKLQRNKNKNNRFRQQQQQQKRRKQQVTRVQNANTGNIFLSRRRRLQRQRRRKQQLRQQKLRRQLLNQRKKLQQINKNNQKRKQQQQLLQRIRRRIQQDVGGGRIDGISKVQRDGDAEMQLFGNYTLIRSHMRIGPVEITMQFRTKNGIRRSGATLPIIRAHTVTRVNHEGSELIDYLLDRPHPESIHVRGTLFPLAQRIARNIFARLFLPNSFLVSKLREKSALAFLSKPMEGRKR